MRDTRRGEASAGHAELHGLAALFEAERPRLRYDPATAGRLLRSITLALSHPAIHPGDPCPRPRSSPCFLDGIRRPSE